MAHCIYTQAENILTKLKDSPPYQKRIEYAMSSLKAVLLDAEEKQEQNQRLQNWLKELQNVFYQVEDSIDEFKWEIFKQKDIGKQVLAPFSCSNQIYVLRVCYDQMPSQLKPCFLHCSQLPNDRIISSNDMIQLWMANGLLHSPEEKNSTMENIGEKYFMELWSRYFIQEIEEHGLGYWIKLHPLIQKLAHKITQEQSEGSGGNNHPKEVTEIRSIAFQERNMVLPNASLTEKCIWKYKGLRLLYLSNADLQEIPNSIGTLKYLRYLDLHGNTKIKHLPNSICNLQSLQTLILGSCSALEDLPKDIRNLISLRYLWVTTNKLRLDKNGVGTMNSLRFLAIGGCNNLENLFERPDCLAGLETTKLKRSGIQASKIHDQRASKSGKITPMA